MRDFKKLLIWQKAMEVVNAVYQAVERFPKEERYGLRSQVTRSSVSIASNIAEGNAKSSEKEKKQYMERALGSAYELETQLLIIEKLNWLKENEAKDILKLIEEEQRMLSTFIDKLKGWWVTAWSLKLAACSQQTQANNELPQTRNVKRVYNSTKH